MSLDYNELFFIFKKSVRHSMSLFLTIKTSKPVILSFLPNTHKKAVVSIKIKLLTHIIKIIKKDNNLASNHPQSHVNYIQINCADAP